MEYDPLPTAFFEELCAWFGAHARDLPWRRGRTPYGVLVSEIMLQQTRVGAVAGYYQRFMRALPDVGALAAAEEQTLLKLWEGLGYYSRARNLQKAARMIAERYGGEFPREYGELVKLPGVGAYTAGAIASVCFEAPAPAVDGNVLRVMARAIGRPWTAGDPRALAEIRALLLPVYTAAPVRGVLTEALMELGAVICTPKNPRCPACPVAAFCTARKAGNAAALPLAKQKTAKPVTALTVFILTHAGRTAVRRRAPRGLLAGLWELPNIQGALTPQDALETAARLFACRPEKLLFSTSHRHEFTHKVWQMTAYAIEAEPLPQEQGAAPSDGLVWAAAAQLKNEIPLPAAFKVFLSAADRKQ